MTLAAFLSLFCGFAVARPAAQQKARTAPDNLNLLDRIVQDAIHDDQIPGAVLTLIEGAGHFTPLEEPEAVKKALRAWLSCPNG